MADMTRSLRIGVDATSYLCAHPRGEGKTLARLYREIHTLAPEVEIVLFGEATPAARAMAAQTDWARVRLFSLPGFRWNTWENLGLPWQAWRAGCHVLHAASSGAPRWSPVPVVMTVHDLVPLLFDDGAGDGARERFGRRLRNGLRSAQEVITVSASTRRDLDTCFPGHGRPVTVVHWAGDHDGVPAAPRAPAATPGHVLAFGGTATRKNAEGTLRAFAHARAQCVAGPCPAPRLVMLGVTDAGLRTRLGSLAAELGLSDALDLPGFVSEADLAGYYRDASALLYLSLYEGFGMPLLEAMAHGVPVVASDVSSIPEVLGDSGVLVDPTDPAGAGAGLAALLADPDRLAERAAAGRARLAHFSWASSAAATLAILRRAATR